MYPYCHNESRSKNHISHSVNTVLTYFHTVTCIVWSSRNHMKEISIYCTITKLYIKYHDCVTYLVALEKAVRSRSISTSIGFNCILSLSSSSSDVSFSLYGSLKQQCYTIITIPYSARLSSSQMLLPTHLLYHSNVHNRDSLKTFHMETTQASCSLQSNCWNAQHFINSSPLFYCSSILQVVTKPMRFVIYTVYMAMASHALHTFVQLLHFTASCD